MMINYDVKFLTIDETLHIKNYDNKSFKYDVKRRSDESVFDRGKKNYCERRGGYWRHPRPRQLKELEAKIRDKTIVKTLWTTDSLITIVFSSGAIAYLTVNTNTLDLSQVLFDRYFVGKLASQTVTNVAICKCHILFTHNDRTATFVMLGKANNSSLPCRISDRDPSLHTVELGGSARRTDRHLSSIDTVNGSRILVWSVTAAEPAPWSPVIEDTANLHLYDINGHNISLVAYHQLENETLHAELSNKQDNIIHIVEQIQCQKSGISIEWIRYSIPTSNRASKLSSRESVCRVGLPAPARCVRRAPCDARLLIACIDGSILVVHHEAGITQSTKAAFIVTEIHWAGELILAAEETGRVQCFDRALSLLHNHTNCFDITSYFKESRRMKVLCMQTVRGGLVVLTVFDGGPLTLLRIRHPRLLTSWIRARRMSNAVSLLRAMDWEVEGTECLWAVNRIVCAALRNGTEAVAEECSAQEALGTYLAPVAPHAAAALRFSPPVHDLARKFFHHLLRRGRAEKALCLAVDLRAWDLAADVRWGAAALQLHALAEEAAALASRYARTHDSECSSSCSDCTSDSYSNSDAETSASSEMTKTKPPPLPRVSLPLLLPVPVSQPEPISTSSIRPNLHQYLERDNTIWNTEIRDETFKSHDNLKSILSTNGSKWNDNGLPNFRTKSLLTVNESSKSLIDAIPKAYEDRPSTAQFKNVFATDIREEVPNTLYRYQNNNYPPFKDRSYSKETNTERGVKTERNKVKFSDTVTIAVVTTQERCNIPEPARELAESLPLCAPHNYLAAFAPHPQPQKTTAHSQAQPPPGTTLDYVEV